MKIFKIVLLMFLLVANPAILLAEEIDNSASSVIPIPSSSFITPKPSSFSQVNNNMFNQAILNSNTYLSVYGLNINSTNNNYLPFYEDLNFKYPLLDNTLSMEGAGWLRYDFLTMPYNGRTDANYTYVYLNYTPQTIPLSLKLGRIYSWFGVANDQYDGIEVIINNIYGLNLGAFVGSEVDSQLHNTPGGITTGGRLSYNNAYFGIGGSMFYAANNEWISQERWGLDVWVRPINILYFFGRYYYDMVDKRAYDGTVKFSLTPTNKWFINGQYGLFNPASLIDKTSIFWVFSTESYRNLTVDVGYRILDNLSFAIEGTKYMYSSYGNSYSYGAKLDYNKKPYALGLKLDKVDSIPTDYLTTRIYAFRSFAMGFYADIDVIYTSYFGSLNSYNHSITGHVAVGKQIIDNLKLTLSGDTIDGPYVRHGGYGMLSLKYSL